MIPEEKDQLILTMTKARVTIDNLIADRDRLAADLKAAYSELRNQRVATRKAQKAAAQDRKDSVAQRATWLQVETEKRRLAARLDATQRALDATTTIKSDLEDRLAEAEELLGTAEEALGHTLGWLSDETFDIRVLNQDGGDWSAELAVLNALRAFLGENTE